MNEISNNIMVYAEYLDEKIHPVTYELLGKARELASKLNGKVISTIIGWNASKQADNLIRYGADIVYVYDFEEQLPSNILLEKDIIVKLAKKIKPEIILFGATPWGRSLAPRIAAALKTGLTADCLDIYIDNKGDIVQVRPAFTGNIIAHIKTRTRPVMSTIRYRVFKRPEPDPNRKGIVNIEKVSKHEILRHTGFKVIKLVREKEVNLADARVIVAGGRGLRKKEDLKLLKELADLLGGVIGVSRPLVDAGWLPKDYQIGFSGNVVKPHVYMAFGISGSPQHLAGMRDSKIIISVNIDPSAPIGRYSDLFVVADLYEVIPILIREIKKLKHVEVDHNDI